MHTNNITDSKAVRRGSGLRLILGALLAAALCGCVRYDVTETNGIKLINVKKPARSEDGSFYTVDLGNGQNVKIPASRVVYIVPHGDTNMVFRD